MILFIYYLSCYQVDLEGGMRTTIVGEQGQRAREEKEHRAMETTTNLPAVLPTDAASARPAPLVPERTNFLVSPITKDAMNSAC